MIQSAGAAKRPPIIPSRLASSGATEESDPHGHGSFSFPSSKRLLIITKKGVYTWDVCGIAEIFRSGSEGIIAAKSIMSAGDMLAVADSQVVVLHDINGGMQRSYRLKGSDGQVRRLKYGKESKHLFFTTTLQNSVQSYSMKQSKLLEPAHTHPSPPSVFAISCSSQFLLSTSPAPLTIHLTRLAFNAPPVLLHPQCSSSAVVAAEFHPERENYFCIGFEDGTAAVYDAYDFYDSHGNGKRQEKAMTLGSSGEKAFIKGLHIGIMTKNIAAFDPGSNGQGGIGSKESGISAVAFVPGRKATVVTVGADGKCCVVDFTQPTKHKAVLLRSWHIRRPATSLSIICSTKNAITGQSDGADDIQPTERQDLTNESYCIAVGSSDGRVLLFDLDGKALGEQRLDDKDAQVIDLEWTEIRSAAVRPNQNMSPSIRRSPVVKRKRKSLGSSTFAESRPSQMGLVALPSNVAEVPKDPLFDFTTPSKTLGAFHWETPSDESTVAAINPRNGVREGSPIVETNENSYQRPTHVNTKGSNGTVQRKAIQRSSPTETKASLSFQSSIDEVSTPPIPPRPTPKPGGRLSMRRAQMSRQPEVQNSSYQSNMAKAKKMSAGSPRLSKALSVTSHPAKTKVLFGPRKPPSPRISDAPDDTQDSNLLIKSVQPKDGWLDVPPETPRRATEVSSVSPATSSKSYRTAVSQPYASDSLERSDETVVDWSVGLPRQPVPTLQITHPSGERPSKAKSKKKKGHVSLSVSSESAGRSTPTPPVSDPAARLPDRSSVGSPSKILPLLPPKSPPGPKVEPQMAVEPPKQKGHVSLSVSSASTNDTITPVSSSDSAGPLVQWPSLKKSPRIPDLNKGLPDPKKYAPPPSASSSLYNVQGTTESATGSILQGYAAPSPSPSPPPRAVAPHASSWLVPSSTSHLPSRTRTGTTPASAAPPLVPLRDEERDEVLSVPTACDFCARSVRAVLEKEFLGLRGEMVRMFAEQRRWLEEMVVRDDDDDDDDDDDEGEGRRRSLVGDGHGGGSVGQ